MNPPNPNAVIVPRVVRQLIALRKRASLSQAGLAELIGTAQSAISQIETGATSPTLATLSRYAHEVGMEVALTPADADCGAPAGIPDGELVAMVAYVVEQVLRERLMAFEAQQ